MLGVVALRAPFQDRPPPGIMRRRPHVVRDKIEDQPKPLAAKGGCQRPQSRLAADLRLDRVEIGDIVAVGGSGRRAGERRGVEMADSESPQIGHEGSRRDRASFRRGTGDDRLRLARMSFRPLLAQPLRRSLRKRGETTSSSRARGSWRRQFGCSSIVPGTFTCSIAPTRSSAGTTMRREGARATAR